MAKKEGKIEGTAEAWEDGLLGCDEEFAQLSELTIEDLDDSLELQPISIRIPKGMLEELKMFAEVEGMRYQSLIKELLNRFIVGEHKRNSNAYMSIKLKEKAQAEVAESKDQERVA